MRGKIMTNRALICLITAVMCIAAVCGVWSLSARAQDEPADGRIYETFEDVNEIYRAGLHTVSADDPHTFVMHTGVGANVNASVETEPNSDPTNKVFKYDGGRGGAGNAQDMYFGTRTVKGFTTEVTVSFDFYFPTVLKADEYFLPQAFSSNAAFGSFYRIASAGDKNVIRKEGTLIVFDDTQVPVGEWFTVTAAVNIARKKADIYITTQGDDGPVYTPVAINADFSPKATDYANLTSKGFEYMRVHGLMRPVAADAETTDYFYLDNMSVQPEFKNYYSVVPMPEDERFRTANADILGRTVATLKRSDYKALRNAFDDYAKLSDEAKAELAEEYAHLGELNENLDDGRLYEDFESPDFDSDMFTEEQNSDVINIDKDMQFGRPKARIPNAETQVIADPTNADNRVYKLGGGKAAPAIDCDWFGSRTLPEYNEKFTVKTSFYLPEVLKDGERFQLILFGIAENRMTYFIQAEGGVNKLMRANVGEASEFVSVELPSNTWFTVAAEGDYANGKLNVYLQTQEGITTCVSAAMPTQLGGGLVRGRWTPVYNIVAAESEDVPSYMLIDDLFVAPEFMLGEQELAELIAAAKTEITEYIGDVDEYSQADKIEAQEILSSLDEILTGSTKAELDVKAATLKARIDGFATAFEAYRAEKVAELESYVSQEDYSTSKWREVRTAISDGIAAINAAQDEAAVDSAFAQAKTAIDAILTLEGEKAELEAALARVKQNAKTALASYKNADDYRAAQKAELASAIEVGNAAIDAAADENGVNNALAEAKRIIDKIKTDAQLTEEENAGGGTDKPTKPDDSDGEKDNGDSDGGCGGNIFADGIFALAVLLLAAAGVCMTFAVKKQK